MLSATSKYKTGNLLNYLKAKNLTTEKRTGLASENGLSDDSSAAIRLFTGATRNGAGQT